jgi:hypothetical protein
VERCDNSFICTFLLDLGCICQTVERRFYPVTFIEKMKIDLQSYKQDKKTITEYEVSFNKIVRFVPHVANNEVEKASQFH